MRFVVATIMGCLFGCLCLTGCPNEPVCPAKNPYCYEFKPVSEPDPCMTGPCGPAGHPLDAGADTGDAAGDVAK